MLILVELPCVKTGLCESGHLGHSLLVNAPICFVSSVS